MVEDFSASMNLSQVSKLLLPEIGVPNERDYWESTSPSSHWISLSMKQHMFVETVTVYCFAKDGSRPGSVILEYGEHAPQALTTIEKIVDPDGHVNFDLSNVRCVWLRLLFAADGACCRVTGIRLSGRFVPWVPALHEEFLQHYHHVVETQSTEDFSLERMKHGFADLLQRLMELFV